jgi:hypothetical protein
MSKLSRSRPVAAAAKDEDKLVALADKIQKAWSDLNSAAEGSAASAALWRRINVALDAMDEIRARSLRGLAAKARVADLLLRKNGEAHSEGPHAWSVIDDLLAIGSEA